MVVCLLAAAHGFSWGADGDGQGSLLATGSDSGLSAVYYTYTAIDNRSEIVIQADGLLGEHRIFSLDAPPRLVVDLEQMTLPVSPLLKEIGRPELLRIRAARRGSAVRFVFDLPPESVGEHHLFRDEDSLKVVIQGPLGEQQEAADNGLPLPPENLDEAAVVPVSVPEPEPSAAKTYQGKSVSVHLFQRDIADFFAEISRQTGERFILSPDITGKISLRLRAIPWDQAVDQVLGYYHLQMSAADDASSWLVERQEKP